MTLLRDFSRTKKKRFHRLYSTIRFSRRVYVCVIGIYRKTTPIILDASIKFNALAQHFRSIHQNWSNPGVCTGGSDHRHSIDSSCDWKMNKLTDKLQFILLNLTKNRDELNASHTKIECKFESETNICTNSTWTIDMNRTRKLLCTNTSAKKNWKETIHKHTHTIYWQNNENRME